MENESSIRKAAMEAVKFWAEQIDFEVLKQNPNIGVSVKKVEEIYAVIEPEKYKALKQQYPNLEDYFLKELKRNCPTEIQLQVFKQRLFKEIVKVVSERKCCYLYTDKDGAGMKLAIIADKCGIQHDEKSWFRKNVEMFVTPGKVELRFDPNAKGLTTYYDETQMTVSKSGKNGKV